MPYVVAQPCVDVKDKACVDECSFFAEVGDLGGASAAGPIGKDPEQVAALPPQNQ